MDEGLYESLLTGRLERDLAARPDLCPQIVTVDDAEQPLALARHLTPLIERALRSAKTAEERAQLTRAILALLAEPDETPNVREARIERLDAVTVANRLTPPPARPATPLSDAALMTNGRGEPTLAAELRAELASADAVDLLCAFVKWQGLRLLEGPLTELRERGVPLRVITTTYLGATDARAIDALVNEFGAEVRVNYETHGTRLHAKAWLLRRNSGFHTAYVGSSNLSHAALVDGLEWNVRLSAKATPHLLKKFRDTFDSYWVAREFALYRPMADGERLREALAVASGRHQPGIKTIALSGLEVQPKPFQAEMLEELDAERSLHDRHRNLIVAATGTGKTVVAALDYRRLVREVHARDLTLLFVAHRKEILVQARRMYQEVLSDATFGELLVGGEQPSRWRHVFASVQSLSAERLSVLVPNHFEVVVIDEFHHADAASYRRLLNHVRPIELLGLTATPERGDGVDVRDFFDGRVASELRLWEALEQNLLCPFHYFGVYDGVDLGDLGWKRGGYDLAGLSSVYTGNDARTRIVLKELRDKVADIDTMRALGFCVSVDHARYMTATFNAAGIPARAVWADTPSMERAEALTALRNREINVIFNVDLFNEGVDIPEVDTVLFLRPTESATVFLQQLGRGLRLTHGKTVLTALDFVGHQRREFRFDRRFRALTGSGSKELERQIAQGFPFLPSGSQIVLDSVAQKIVLENIRQQVSPRWATLVSEVRDHAGTDLAEFLKWSGRELDDVVRNDRSWTQLCRESGKISDELGPRESQLAKRVRALAHVDDRRRYVSYQALLRGGQPDGSPAERRLAEMLFYSLFSDGGGFADAASGLAAVAGEPVLAEMRQVIDIAFDGAHRSTFELGELIPELGQVPLSVHARYSREEILAGLGMAARRKPSHFREGVIWCEDLGVDAFFITLKKAETDYSPTTMYRDFALSPELFHWESQSTTSESSKTGQRYIHHRENGSHVLLFVRQAKQYGLGAAPYVFLGPADYVSHEAEKPMAITWRLHKAMPTELFTGARVAVA
ncbi:helicase [Mycolicibacter engbaekii]|uniref:Helicase n=1 Tax=Mycolicibacter engbaekii TaxID=188915 RepID=A0A1X1TX91_9MYCO|nr:DEAD/DEAH box helicase [Mycolicibacter engbaekii]ORV49018.1 helicase [Mycolicibacter engbaekii]